MTHTTSLDHEITTLGTWIVTAGRALLQFYNADNGFFWRDNVEKTRNVEVKSATSTLRSFAALLELKRFLLEEDIRDKVLQKDVSRVLISVAERYLTENPARDEVRGSGTNGINNFTDSHLLLAGSLLETLRRLLECEDIKLSLNVDNVRKALEPIRDGLIGVITQKHGAGLQSDDLIHDFISLHALRALDTFQQVSAPKAWPFESALQQRVRNDVLRQLGYHSARVASRFDASELAFSVVLVNRLPSPEAPQLTRRAIQAICEAQREGCWPPARPVYYGTSRLLHIVSYEVALALTQLVSLQLREDSYEVPEEQLLALAATFNFVRTSFSSVGASSGWVNDHARSESLIESWTTAIVLTFLIQYRDTLLAIRQRGILAKYTVKASHCVTPCVWPDLVPSMRRPNWVDPERANAICDPTENGELTAAIKESIIVPTSRDPFFRPKKVSLVLYGSPGTRKTSLVLLLAESLRWPMLTISPPDFLKTNGLEGFEASAAAIFEDLSRLRRVVVLFDECEDFFKMRSKGTDQDLGSRTIGAFITAGMLPRLQALRDRRWVFFVLATNTPLTALDEAVTRLGRFDWSHEMGHPSAGARVRYLAASQASSALWPDLKRALAEYHAANQNQEVSFAHLDLLAKSVADFAPDQVEGLIRKLGQVVNEPSPPPLVRGM